jgi:MFS family permease
MQPGGASPADLPHPPEPAPRAGAFSTRDHIAVSLLWFALFAQWLTVVPIIVPDQIAGLLGGDNPAREGISGSINAAGAAVALVIAPLAGALSDRKRGSRGRRRPFLIQGMVASSVSLGLLALFGPGGNILLYGLAVLNLQFWWNWAAGPYAGLIPDIVPAGQQPTASGWLNVMTVLGIIAGNALVFLLYAPDRPALVLGLFAVMNLLFLWLSLAFVRERPALVTPPPLDAGAFARSFYLEPREHPNFYWVLVTRLFANMGIWSIFTFLIFYLQDVVGLGRAAAAALLPQLLLGGAALAIPASLVGVRLADRHGLVAITRIASWLMAAAAICYVLIALSPSLLLVIPVVMLFAAANGAYGAVDWALALRVLPAGRDAGKDMGIWHICMVLPQVVGQATSGWLISGIKVTVSARLAYAVAFGIAALWFILAAWLVTRVRLRERD